MSDARHPSPLIEDPLYIELRRTTLQRIVDNYDAIEFDLAQAAIAEFKAIAKRTGLTSWITGGRDDINGQLRVSILRSPTREELREYREELQPLGRLRTVVVESDLLGTPSLRRYAELLAGIVKRKYDALLMALEVHGKEVSEHSLDSCRGLVMAVLQKDDQVNYYDDCWLIAFDEENGTLLLSEEILHRALVYFRNHPGQAMSPLEMVLSLMRTKFPYKHTLSFVANREGRPRLIGEFRSSKYKQSAMDLWLAIGTLHNFEDFGVVPLAAAGPRALTLGCKARVLDRVLSCLAPHRAAIEAEFRRGADQFIPLISPVRYSTRYPPGAYSPVIQAPALQSSRYSVFISYSKIDRDIVGILRDGLAPSVDNGLVEILFDEMIEKGEPWEASLKTMIERADAGVFLVSVASLASPTIMKMELPLMLGRVNTRGAVLRWLPVQHCLWQETPFSALQASWPSNTPLRSMTATEHDKAIQLFCQDIVRMAKTIRR